MISNDIKYFCNLQEIFTQLKKTMKTRIIKNIFNKSERRCRDVKTQKACKQGWEAYIGSKIKKPLPYNPT